MRTRARTDVICRPVSPGRWRDIVSVGGHSNYCPGGEARTYRGWMLTSEPVGCCFVSGGLAPCRLALHLAPQCTWRGRHELQMLRARSTARERRKPMAIKCKVYNARRQSALVDAGFNRVRSVAQWTHSRLLPVPQPDGLLRSPWSDHPPQGRPSPPCPRSGASETPRGSRSSRRPSTGISDNPSSGRR